MEKLKELMPLGMLLSFVAKVLFVPAGFADMGIIMALSAICALQYFLEKHNKLQTVVKTVNEQNIVLEKMAKELSDMRTHVGALKMQGTFTGQRKTG